jgi:hypothetical protein
MNNPENSITEQIVSGPITIESAEKFEKLLKSSPNDPALWKAFVDLLIKKGNGIPSKGFRIINLFLRDRPVIVQFWTNL